MTKTELVALAKKAGKPLTGTEAKKNKDDIVALVAARVSDEQAQKALVKFKYVEADEAQPQTAPVAEAATAAPSADAPTADAPGTAVDIPPAASEPVNAAQAAPADPYETAGDVAINTGNELPALEERHLPKLGKLGAQIKRIKKQRKTRTGDDPGTWWCPFTDYSVLIGGDPDICPQSGAIRVTTEQLEENGLPVAYAVVLPVQGVPPGALK